MSLPYKSQIMSDIVKQACGMVQKERKSLVELKLLLTIFRGDHSWIPCGRLYTDDDVSLFFAEPLPAQPQHPHIKESDGLTEVAPDVRVSGATYFRDTDVKKEPNGLETDPSSIFKEPDEVSASMSREDRAQEITTDDRGCPPLQNEASEGFVEPESSPPPRNNDLHGLVTTINTDHGTIKHSAEEERVLVENSKRKQAEKLFDEDPPKRINPHRATSAHIHPSPLVQDDAADNGSLPSRMLTRGQAHAQATTPSNLSRHKSRSTSPSSSQPILAIHPLYFPPTTTLPDRNHGLPETEADDMRRILSALVQKQEEVVRGSEQMYEGLLKAHRLTRMVWRWCRAEGHVGEMSDGEDWVDLEEWGLDSPLEKGQVYTEL